MTEETENPKNAVERSVSGGFTATWRGRTVYENGRVKKFETEDIARLYLIRCDEAGKIIR
jgi:hypothetical protein